MTLKMVGKMIVGEVSWKNVTGPITIADYAGQTARIGLISYLGFIAFVSISLGVMNLLPIPVLDGGHLLYYAVEVLTGRPVSERFGAIAQRAGIGILMTLMLVAVFNDITNSWAHLMAMAISYLMIRFQTQPLVKSVLNSSWTKKKQSKKHLYVVKDDDQNPPKYWQ